MPTLGGTHGDDVLAGKEGNDVLWGGSGNDELMGRAGDDRLEGGPGADLLDGGPGTDIADYVKSPEGVQVRLDGTGREGDAEGDVLTGIENVWGSAYDDRIFGTSANNGLYGNDGNDTLFGNRGDDTVAGEAGSDILWGGEGDDTLRGGLGDDVLEGGAGADEIDGGEDGGLPLSPTTVRGSIWGDTATYVDSDAGVTIDLAMGTAQGGDAEGDTLTGIESVRGSDHADMLVARNDDPATEELPEGSTLYGQKGDDTLSGGTGVDRLWGGKGDDVLMGGAANDYLEGGFGADVIDGGDGNDYAGYELSDAGVTIDLSTGTAQGGHAEGDTLTGIEGVSGSSHADRLTGDAGFNVLVGGAGADTLDGGAGLNDYAFYGTSDAGVTVNLATGTAQGGHAEGDTLTGIENVFGSNHADHLTGDAGRNNLIGADGDDALDGGAGDDNLQGRAGADMLDGGEGDDTAAYRSSDAGVTVNLATGLAQGGHAEGDALRGIESVFGSIDHADHLTGDTGDNSLNGQGGDDTLDGGAGDDQLHGGAGADMIDGGEGHDTVDYWGSDTGVTVNLATGTGQGGEAEGDTLTGDRESLGVQPRRPPHRRRRGQPTPWPRRQRHAGGRRR